MISSDDLFFFLEITVFVARKVQNDQHGLGSKPTRAVRLCPWERHFTAHSLLGGPGKQF